MVNEGFQSPNSAGVQDYQFWTMSCMEFEPGKQVFVWILSQLE